MTRAPKHIMSALLLLATPCFAQPGSNIGLTEYPAPKCEKPQAVPEELRPRVPPDPTEDQANIYNARLRTYNAAIREHNGRMEVFNACMQAYMAAGNADARRIRDALEAAVALSNAK
jgi:hypothetical protein